jgi:hypothetical protein
VVGISRLNSAVNPEQAGDWVKFLLSLKVAFISGGTLLLITGILPQQGGAGRHG